MVTAVDQEMERLEEKKRELNRVEAENG